MGVVQHTLIKLRHRAWMLLNTHSFSINFPQNLLFQPSNFIIEWVLLRMLNFRKLMCVLEKKNTNLKNLK